MKKTLTPIDPNIGYLRAVVYAKDQPEYLPLPANKTVEGDVITCWRPNWYARLALLFGANIFITLKTFNNPLQPMRVEVEKPNPFIQHPYINPPKVAGTK